MNIDGKPHPHSFLRDGTETRNVDVTCRRETGITIRSGLQGLLVLKSTGSAFHGFIRDEYTTLGETRDRILSTEVDSTWEWNLFKTLDDVRKLIPNFDVAWQKARDITLKTFAEDNSASVQATMYKMADQILAAVPQVNHVDYSLPNKHYFEISKSTNKATPSMAASISKTRCYKALFLVVNHMLPILGCARLTNNTQISNGSTD